MLFTIYVIIVCISKHKVPFSPLSRLSDSASIKSDLVLRLLRRKIFCLPFASATVYHSPFPLSSKLVAYEDVKEKSLNFDPTRY